LRLHALLFQFQFFLLKQCDLVGSVLHVCLVLLLIATNKKFLCVQAVNWFLLTCQTSLSLIDSVAL
jgi:hypothetical protein